MPENAKIKQIQIDSTTYDIYASSADNAASLGGSAPTYYASTGHGHSTFSIYGGDASTATLTYYAYGSKSVRFSGGSCINVTGTASNSYYGIITISASGYAGTLPLSANSYSNGALTLDALDVDTIYNRTTTTPMYIYGFSGINIMSTGSFSVVASKSIYLSASYIGLWCPALPYTQYIQMVSSYGLHIRGWSVHVSTPSAGIDLIDSNISLYTPSLLSMYASGGINLSTSGTMSLYAQCLSIIASDNIWLSADTTHIQLEGSTIALAAGGITLNCMAYAVGKGYVVAGYQHNVRLYSASKVYARFQIYNSTYTSFTNMASVAEALYNASYRTVDTALMATGRGGTLSGSVITGIYATGTANTTVSLALAASTSNITSGTYGGVNISSAAVVDFVRIV